jgi:hypothetical protein
MFKILTGESKGIGLVSLSKDLKGNNLKIKLVARFFVNITLNAPFVPSEGLIVPDK